MIIHDLAQGTQEWHEFRSNHYGASEAPAMMGKSKYQTRTELIEAKKYGVKEVDEHTQRLFDAGHAAEGKAIAIAERIIGEPLFPVTGSKKGTKLSASFDGLTMDHSIAWEHKLWNERLATAINAGDTLSEHYTIQLDQQLLVSGAEKILFMCSDGTEENCSWVWYVPGDLSYLEPAWDQFGRDLSAYEPAPETDLTEVKSIDDLPALKINVTGMVQNSNLKLYEDQAKQFIESINTDLETDEDFANAEKLAKFCKDAEKEIESAKKAALAQTEDIDVLFKTIDRIKEDMRQKRLQLDKKVKTQKEKIKREILSAAQDKLGEHIRGLAATCGEGIISSAADFAGAMKNKRTLKSLRDACDTELARAKLAANERHALVMKNRESIPGDYEFLFNDFQQIALKSNDDFVNLVGARVAAHKQQEAAKFEAERAKIKAEAEQEANRIISEKAEEGRQRSQAKRTKKDVLLTCSQAKRMYEDGMQLIAMHVDGCGFLPLIKNGEAVEQYRGEYQASATEAIHKCVNFLEMKKNG